MSATKTLSEPFALEASQHLETALSLFSRAMVGLPHGLLDLEELQEPGRVLGIFDEDELVGTANSYASSLTLPGGSRVPHAAVTHIGIKVTHRRRGLATRLILAQLRQARADGEIVASLRASQPGIYERFGYGVASLSAELAIDTRAARLRAGARRDGEVREVPVAGSARLQSRVYDSHARGRAGAISRPESWWRVHRVDEPSRHQYLAVHGPAGVEDGFVRFHPIGTDEWFHSRERTIVVDDLVAASLDVEIALIGHLLDLDLVDRVVIGSAPHDHPLADLFTDVRAVQTLATHDETWLRLVDVEAALAARTYRSGAPLVVEVTDPLLAENNARFAIGGERVERTATPADLRVGIDALAAVFLGRPAWRALEATGRVHEQTPGALQEAERRFVTSLEPYSGTVF